MSKTTEIVVESTRTVVFDPRIAVRAWCGACRGEVEMLRPGECALLAGVSSRSIYALAEAGALHFAETPDGLLFICVSSLAEAMDRSTRDTEGLIRVDAHLPDSTEYR